MSKIQEKFTPQIPQTPSDQFRHLQTLFRKSVNEQKSETASRISIISQTLFVNFSTSIC